MSKETENSILQINRNASKFIIKENYQFTGIELTNNFYEAKTWELQIKMKSLIRNESDRAYVDLSLDKISIFIGLLNNMIFINELSDIGRCKEDNLIFTGIYSSEGNKMLDLEKFFIISSKLNSLISKAHNIEITHFEFGLIDSSINFIIDQEMLSSYNLPVINDEKVIPSSNRYLFDVPWWFRDDFDTINYNFPSSCQNVDEIMKEYSTNESVREIEYKFLSDRGILKPKNNIVTIDRQKKDGD